MYEGHLCVVALTSIERGIQFFPPVSYFLGWPPTALVFFYYFQVNNGVLYFLDYVEDIYIMVLSVLVSMYNGGLLPDIILLTQGYYHRGTRLNAMKRFCICILRSHLSVLTFSPPD